MDKYNLFYKKLLTNFPLSAVTLHQHGTPTANCGTPFENQWTTDVMLGLHSLLHLPESFSGHLVTTGNRQNFRETEIACWILTVAQNHTRTWTALRLYKVPSAALHHCHLLVSINNTLQLLHIDYARSDVLQAAALQFPIFWDLTMDKIVEIGRRFGIRRFYV